MGRRRRQYNLPFKLPETVCKVTGKVCHSYEESAEDQIKSLKRAHKIRTKTIRTYQCDHCGKWHVGH